MSNAEDRSLNIDIFLASSVSRGMQFMNPKMMVKKGGKCPEGDINTWFFEGDSLRDHVHKKLPKATASKMQIGQTKFGQYPENLLMSRRRFGKAFQVCSSCYTTSSAGNKLPCSPLPKPFGSGTPDCCY